MSFRPEQIAAFRALFERYSPHIRAFEGCLHLELWQDADEPTVFCTYSHWQDSAALETYRNSELFATVWQPTRQLFADRPAAFSVHRVATPKPADAQSSPYPDTIG